MSCTPVTFCDFCSVLQIPIKQASEDDYSCLPLRAHDLLLLSHRCYTIAGVRVFENLHATFTGFHDSLVGSQQFLVGSHIFLVRSHDFLGVVQNCWSNCIDIQSENTNKLWERTKNLWDTTKNRGIAPKNHRN